MESEGDSQRRTGSVSMSSTFTESIVEEAAFAWLESVGYAVLHGPDIAAGMPDRITATWCFRMEEVKDERNEP